MSYNFNVHYGGYFNSKPETSYECGSLERVEGIESNGLTLDVLKEELTGCGNLDGKLLLYQSPGKTIDEEGGLVMLENDSHLESMFFVYGSRREIHLYVGSYDSIPGAWAITNASDDVFWRKVAEHEALADGNIGRDAGRNHGSETSESSAYANSEVLRSPVASDDEIEILRKGPVFFDENDVDHPTLLVGMRFIDVNAFRGAIRAYNARLGRDIKWLKNERSRVVAACKFDCGWKCYGKPVPGEEKSYLLRRLDMEHTCPIVRNTSCLTSKALANRYIGLIGDQPDIKIHALCGQVRRDYNVDLSRWVAYRMKRFALSTLYGDYDEQYNKLYDYCETLLLANKNSTIKLKLRSDIPNLNPVFQRMYVCMDAMKTGFVRGCRPFIGLDGTHLKGPYGGQLLAAVARDGNNYMFPIAIAAVEVENLDSWQWFLELLLDDIDCERQIKWTFMSDRQKGLVEALNKVVPECEHRICVLHLYGNMRDAGIKVRHLKDDLWGAATAYTLKKFKHHMSKIQMLDDDAFTYLSKLDARSWSRSHFCLVSKCDLLVNNICESFNSYIINARHLPLVSMMECIRKNLMSRFESKRVEGNGFSNLVCPVVVETLDKMRRDTRHTITRYAGNGHFEIETVHAVRTVNLRDRECSCRAWQLSGIPCVHATSAILADNGNLEAYCDEYFYSSRFRMTYESIIYPVPSKDEWLESGKGKIEPPMRRKVAGRPRKKRNRKPDETTFAFGKYSKRGVIMHCSRCKQGGHNVRACTGNLTDASGVGASNGGATRGGGGRRGATRGGGTRGATRGGGRRGDIGRGVVRRGGGVYQGSVNRGVASRGGVSRGDAGRVNSQLSTETTGGPLEVQPLQYEDPNVPMQEHLDELQDDDFPWYDIHIPSPPRGCSSFDEIDTTQTAPSTQNSPPRIPGDCNKARRAIHKGVEVGEGNEAGQAIHESAEAGEGNEAGQVYAMKKPLKPVRRSQRLIASGKSFNSRLSKAQRSDDPIVIDG